MVNVERGDYKRGNEVEREKKGRAQTEKVDKEQVLHVLEILKKKQPINCQKALILLSVTEETTSRSSAPERKWKGLNLTVHSILAVHKTQEGLAE